MTKTLILLASAATIILAAGTLVPAHNSPAAKVVRTPVEAPAPADVPITAIPHYHRPSPRLGPLHMETYSEMVQRPEVHGYVTVELIRDPRGDEPIMGALAGTPAVDVFKFRQRIDGANATLVYRDVRRVLETSTEVDVQDFDIQFEGLPLTDVPAELPLQSALPEPRRILVSWREISVQ